MVSMRERILIFNHSSNILELYRAALSGHGYQVFTRIEDMTSLKEVEEVEPELIIFGNVKGIGEDEFRILRELREHPLGRTIPVIISTTAPHTASLMTEIQRLKQTVLLAKPFDYQGLLNQVREILDNSSHKIVSAD
jgi:DNA-binding response OmpR family regulator